MLRIFRRTMLNKGLKLNIPVTLRVDRRIASGRLSLSLSHTHTHTHRPDTNVLQP